MNELIATNYRLLESATWLYGQLQTDRQLRLFQNNVIPTPETVAADLQESTFPGYVAVPLVGKWRVPRKVKTGLYLIDISPIQFTLGAPAVQQVFGCYVTHLGSVDFVNQFDPPIDLSSPGLFNVYVGVTEWALAVAPLP